MTTFIYAQQTNIASPHKIPIIEKLITLLKDYDNSIYNYLHKFTYRDATIKAKETSFLRNMLEENIIRFNGSNDILQFLKTGNNDNKITKK